MARNDQKVFESFIEKSDKSFTKTGCKIVFPVRYKNKDLASFGDYNEVLAVLMIVLPDGTYGVLRDICKIRLVKTSYRIEQFDGEDMYVFEYAEGEEVIGTHDVLVDKLLPYYTYEYFIDKGYVPSFLTYEDMMLMWDNVTTMTGQHVGSTMEIIRFIISIIARHPEDTKVFYRQALNQGYTGKPKWVAFSSVIHGPRTVTAKLIGARFTPALITALVTEHTKPEKIEDFLRRN